MIARNWVHTLTCLHGTSWGQLSSYSVFPFMKIYFGFMALQGGHTKLLTGSSWKNGPSCITGQTQRKDISKIAGPNTDSCVTLLAVWIRSRTRTGTASPPNMAGQLELDPRHTECISWCLSGVCSFSMVTGSSEAFTKSCFVSKAHFNEYAM